ncbi:hypothetical protein GLW08_20425 [Pontibacillus yanchengensis]|uniref:Uncharacterized protein n=2 Tax=Pontibacillus yanchengensis TaxID=462910 RepID=A0ACC7VL03_9BACI|nr:hypothetical protein [Pontibacillus yanchengensis]MYL35471.1 hypothetical protein [Pontibacillus yanchengensis]MYL55671.1 hypothetical protein [Pontibacillus yanchengensis]
MKKVLLIPAFLFALALMMVSFGDTSYAAAKEGSFKTKILDIQVEIPYEKSSVNLERESTSDSETIKVYDKETGKLLKESTVEKANKKAMSLQGDVTTQGTSLYTVSESRVDNGLTSTLNAVLELYDSGSFRQINAVDNMYWTTSSGNHDLVNKQASDVATDGSYPTTEVQISGAATIEVEIDQGASAGFEAAGFSVSASTSTTYTARKNIEEGFTYSTYNRD